MKPDFVEDSTSNYEMPAKHFDVYKKIQSKVGLKEDAQYKELYNEKDPYGESFGYLAVRNFKRFVAVVYHLIEEQGIQYDVVIGAGDSGIGLARVTEMIYEKLGKKPPVTLNLPIIRWEPKWFNYTGQSTKLFDNTVLEPGVKEKTNELTELKNILFVDDEIKNGTTAKASAKVVIDAVGQDRTANDLTVTVVAEDQGFTPKNIADGFDCQFYPFATESGVSNAVSYIVPWSIEKQIREHCDNDEVGSKIRLNSLLGLPSKESERFEDNLIEKPEFTTRQLDKLVKEVPNFKSLQTQFEGMVNNWIDEAIKEYKKDDK